MMIEPRAGRLLHRVADSLEAAADGRQLEAAAWLLRDLAGRIDGHAAAVRHDIADMEAALRLLGVQGEADQGGSQDDEQLHRQLQLQVMQLQQARRNEPALRALHLAMLERERALLGPPGGNPSLSRKQTPKPETGA